VKTPGSNTPPTANDASAETLTGQPVDIRLTGHDVDFLDGRFDPLWFSIEARPQHGEFVAPLYPFFIDDYRTKPEDGLGEDYVPGQDVYAYITHKYCQQGLNPPLNFVFDARFVHVTDDGTHYVLDDSFSCVDKSADTRRRISKWDRDGNFLGQMRFGPGAEDWPMNDAFVLDRDGFLYYSTILEPGSSSAEMFLNRCRTDFITGNGSNDAQASELCAAEWKFENSSDPHHRLDVRNLSYARVDSQQEIAFITDKSHVFAFHIVDNHSADYLGEFGPIQDGAVLDGWLGNGQGIEAGSQGNLYVADSGYHRIHKFGRSYFDQDGHFVMGEYIGWAGEDEVLQTQIEDGLPFQYQLTVTNGVPSVGDGLVAGEVTLDGELPPELVIGAVTTTKGSCTLDGNLVSCALGSLVPGEEVTLTVNVSGPGTLRANTDMDFSGEVTTTSPALESAMSFFVRTTVLAEKANLCVGDCNGDGMVAVDELVKGVNITLGTLPLSECGAMDFNGDVAVTVDELVTAVTRALDGCP